MKKILIRAGMSPLDTFDPTQIILNNSIGGNVGNLVYQYSVIRNLMTEGKTITPDQYIIDPSKASEINEKYDCYVIPLADAFRPDFVTSLRKYTSLIKKLNIPVYVIGVGLRAPFEPKLNEGFPFDKDVKAFVDAVLEKSTMIGVRGQITADYLTRLGYREGEDHVVIGCPSMYSFGRELKIRNTNITTNSLVSINSSRLSPDNLLDFIDRSAKQFPNHYFIPQWKRELILTYIGAPSLSHKDDKNYPNKMSHPMYMDNKVRFPLNTTGWLDLMKSVDLSFGARLHGNIAAVIAGTPSIIFPKDARMRELAEYHNLTKVMANEITEKTNLLDLIEQVDFHSVEKNQAENFDRFIAFLDKNGIEHIHKNSGVIENAPLDQAIAKVNSLPPLETIAHLSLEQQVKRWESYYPKAEAIEAKKLKDKEAKIKEQKKIISNQESKIKHQKGTLNRKSVKLALKVANKFG